MDMKELIDRVISHHGGRIFEPFPISYGSAGHARAVKETFVSAMNGASVVPSSDSVLRESILAAAAICRGLWGLEVHAGLDDGGGGMESVARTTRTIYDAIIAGMLLSPLRESAPNGMILVNPVRVRKLQMRNRALAKRIAVTEPDACTDFRRAGGDVICEKCDFQYIYHPEHPTETHLHILCDGSLVKL